MSSSNLVLLLIVIALSSLDLAAGIQCYQGYGRNKDGTKVVGLDEKESFCIGDYCTKAYTVHSTSETAAAWYSCSNTTDALAAGNNCTVGLETSSMTTSTNCFCQTDFCNGARSLGLAGGAIFVAGLPKLFF